MIDYKSVRARFSLVQVIESEGVRLRRQGSRLVAHCPFHQDEHRPSFTVYPDTRTFFCFGCGAWGDVVDFVKRLHNVSSKEAVAYLEGGRPSATPLHRETPPRSPSAPALTPEGRAVLDKAVAFYERNLDNNREAMQYLLERGLTLETIHAERLGYCGKPGHPSGLSPQEPALSLPKGRSLAKTLGIRERHLAQAIGLLNEQGKERMWQRLTFPVLRRGKPIWLIGRSLGDDTRVKYLGLAIPKPLMGEDSLAGRREVWVVEGVFDLLMLRQLARELHRTIPAVALLGTHPTTQMVQALKQKSRVFLCLDSDAAGKRAALDLRRELGDRAVLVELPPRSKDIGELLPDEVKDLVLRTYLAPECETTKEVV